MIRLKSQPLGSHHRHPGCKGPVKLMQRVKISHSFLVCVKSVPLYHFKLTYVVLHLAVKEFFTSKNEEICCFNTYSTPYL